MLTLNNIHHHLISKGIISEKEMVLGDYSVRQLRTRNNLFRVSTSSSAYFIKSLGDPEGNAQYRLQRDATCLHLIQNEERYKVLSTYTARYYGYFIGQQFLVMDYFRDTMSLDAYYRKNLKVPMDVFERIIEILAHLHEPLPELSQLSKSFHFFPQSFPWALELDNAPLRNIETIQDSQERAIQYLVRNNNLTDLIDHARHSWKATTLIHGDIKYLNFLIGPENDIKIIDWEYSDIGDPLWDLAGFFQNIINAQLLQHEGLLNIHYSRYEIPLELRSTWPIISQLWSQYVILRPEHSFIDDIGKVLQFTASRMLQTSIEYNLNTTSILPVTQKLMEAAEYLYTSISELTAFIIQARSSDEQK